MFILKGKKNDKEDEFIFALTDFLRNSSCHYADIVDDIAELEKKFSADYKDFVEFQKSPSKVLEVIEKMGEKDAKEVYVIFKLLKLIIKISTLDQSVRNVMHLDYKEKKQLAENLRSIADEIKNEFDKIKEKMESKSDI